MAAREGVIGRTISQLIAWLAIPRVLTFPILLFMGVGLSELAWRLVDSVKIFAWASGMLTPFCMICATAVWSMRDRMDDLLDTDVMTARAYEAFVELTSAQRRRSTVWASFVAILALVSSAPAVSNQLVGPVWHWMVIAGGVSASFAIYAYLLSGHWEKQIRAYRSSQKLETKRRQERSDLLEEIRGSGKATEVRTGWVEGPPLNAPTKHHH